MLFQAFGNQCNDAFKTDEISTRAWCVRAPKQNTSLPLRAHAHQTIVFLHARGTCVASECDKKKKKIERLIYYYKSIEMVNKHTFTHPFIYSFAHALIHLLIHFVYSSLLIPNRLIP